MRAAFQAATPTTTQTIVHPPVGPATRLVVHAVAVVHLKGRPRHGVTDDATNLGKGLLSESPHSRRRAHSATAR